MTFVLWLIAVILVIVGIVTIVRGQVLWGIVLIVVGLLVGPGGVSLFDDDDKASPFQPRTVESVEEPQQSTRLAVEPLARQRVS